MSATDKYRGLEMSEDENSLVFGGIPVDASEESIDLALRSLASSISASACLQSGEDCSVEERQGGYTILMTQGAVELWSEPAASGPGKTLHIVLRGGETPNPEQVEMLTAMLSGYLENAALEAVLLDDPDADVGELEWVSAGRIIEAPLEDVLAATEVFASTLMSMGNAFKADQPSELQLDDLEVNQVETGVFEVVSEDVVLRRLSVSSLLPGDPQSPAVVKLSAQIGAPGLAAGMRVALDGLLERLNQSITAAPDMGDLT